MTLTGPMLNEVQLYLTVDNNTDLRSLATDKKQKDAFKLSGWKFQVREDLAGKDAKRLKRCFEIKNDTLKKSYEVRDYWFNNSVSCKLPAKVIF